MDSIYQTLSPYSSNIRFFGQCLSYVQHLTGMFMVYDIIKTGNTTDITVGPILSNIVLCLLNLKFHFMIKDVMTARISVFGIVMNLFYLLIYYSFTTDENTITVWNHISLAGILLFSCLLWVEHEDEDKVEYRFGMLLYGIFIFLAGSPILELSEIISIKSIKGLRLPVVCLGFITSTVWILYGISINDRFVVGENACIFMISLIKLCLFAIYPSTRTRRRSRIREN